MKIMILDDHPLFRDGFANLLQQAEPQAIVLQAGSVEDGLRLIEAHDDIDVVVIDLVMPGAGGFSAIGAFARVRQDLPVIVMSSSENPNDVRRALSLGALGYVPKSASSTAILAAVKLVMNGDLYIPPLILHGATGFAPTDDARREALDRALTRRQVDVLRLLAQGLSNRDIATELDLSEKTVKVHITSLFRVLKVVNRTQAVSTARAAGLI